MNTGVYKILNLKTKDFYIGSAALSFHKRRIQHWSLLKLGKHHSIHLQRAWNKYGENKFKFVIIEKCDPEKCIEKEQYYLDTLKPKYNILPKADSRKGSKLSPEHKKKAIKALNDNRWKLDLPEIRKKMSDYHKGRKKTKEHALKVGAASKKKILQYTQQGYFVREWNCVKDAETFYKCCQGCVSRALSGRAKTFRRFIWKYFKPNYSLKISTKNKNNGKFI